MEEILSNCIGYVWLRLGLTPVEEDRQDFPTKKGLEEKFETLGPENAVAAAWISRRSDTVLHMAVIDENDPRYVWQRPKVGSQEERVSLDQAGHPYPPKWYERVFLRPRKHTGQ